MCKKGLKLVHGVFARVRKGIEVSSRGFARVQKGIEVGSRGFARVQKGIEVGSRGGLHGECKINCVRLQQNSSITRLFYDGKRSN